jgi:phage gp46-like protein
MSESAQYFLPAPSTSASGNRSARAPDRRRYLDPSTRDYVAEGGRLKQDEGFTSKVVLALSTRLGSAQAYPTFGSRLHEIKRADEQGRQLAEKHALRALSHLTSEIRELHATATLPERTPGRIELTISGRRGRETVRVDYTAVLGGGS